ncbi:MAG: hypothetical protein ACRCX2_04390 [Paraclostridium sp.]
MTVNLRQLYRDFPLDKLLEEKWYANQLIEQYSKGDTHFKSAIINHNLEKVNAINNILEVRQWTM